MKIVTNPRVFPRKSVTGRQGALLDTGWMWDHPGPGQIYLHEREVAEIVRNGKHMPGVAEVLIADGWADAETTAAAAEIAAGVQAELEAKVAWLEARLQAFETLYGNVTAPPIDAPPVSLREGFLPNAPLVSGDAPAPVKKRKPKVKDAG